MVNVDTDMIIPKQFLTTTSRLGLSRGLFYEMRYDLNGKPKPGFILNQPQYQQAKILLALDNFGCGSSREHAVWALLDFGIKCVIAPSFADIFFNNCFKNGVLPIVLKPEEVAELIKLTTEHLIDIDLENQEVRAQGKVYRFKIDSFQKRCLLLGLDQIALTLENEDKISEFEKNNRKKLPWLN